MRCPKPEPHKPHWHTVMARNIVVAGGECWGLGRKSEDRPATSQEPAADDDTGEVTP